MNNTITLSQLITRLAAVTGVDNNTARRFLRTLFATVEDALAEGHSVTIKGVGTFRPVNDEFRGTGITVAFTPDKEIAAELNKPFEMFTAVELADGLTFDDETPIENAPETTPVETVSEETPTIETVIEETPDEPEPPEIVVSAMPETVVTETPEIPAEPQPEPRTLRWPEEEEEQPAPQTPTHLAEPEPAAEIHEDEEEPQPRRRNLLWLWISLILLVVCIGAYLVAVYTTPVGPRIETDDQEEIDIAAADSMIEEIPVENVAMATPEPQATAEAGQAQATTPKPEAEAAPAQVQPKAPVYDTVDVSLIRLAKKHYGESSYWVFIYEANTDIISNPNRIRPGQRVVIPDRSTLPGASTAETRAIAKQKQTELLNRFK